MSKFPSMMLDEEVQAFYAALGKSITQWQAVEELLAIIFSATISDDGRSHTTYNAAFHAVININSKVVMIESALTSIAFMSAFERPWVKKAPCSLRGDHSDISLINAWRDATKWRILPCTSTKRRNLDSDAILLLTLSTLRRSSSMLESRQLETPARSFCMGTAFTRWRGIYKVFILNGWCVNERRPQHVTNYVFV
jgi:hypothetical protein